MKLMFKFESNISIFFDQNESLSSYSALLFNSDDFSDSEESDSSEDSAAACWLNLTKVIITAVCTTLLISCCSFFCDRLFIIDTDVSLNMFSVVLNWVVWEFDDKEIVLNWLNELRSRSDEIAIDQCRCCSVEKRFEKSDSNTLMKSEDSLESDS